MEYKFVMLFQVFRISKYDLAYLSKTANCSSFMFLRCYFCEVLIKTSAAFHFQTTWVSEFCD